MAYLESKKTIIGRLESVPGTAAPLGSKIAYRINDPSFTPNIETTSLKYANNDFGGGDVIIGKQSGDFGFNMKASTDSFYNDPPSISPWLVSCGLGISYISDSGFYYEPSEVSADKCLTISNVLLERGANPKAKEYRYAGCYGSFVLKADGIGAPVQFDFTYKGKYDSVIDISNGDVPTALNENNLTPGVSFLDTDITIGGVDVCVSSFSFDAGNDIQGEPCQSDKSGYKRFGKVSANDPTLSMTIQQKSVADFNEMLAMTEGTDFEIIIKVNGTVPFIFSVWRAQLIAVPQSDSDGTSSLDVQFKAKRDTGSSNPGGVYGILFGVSE